MKRQWKKYVIKWLVISALAVLLLSLVATVSGGKYLCINTVYEIFLTNICILFGVWIVEKVECIHVYVEIFLDLLVILMVLIPAGFLFQWYESISIGILVGIGISVYVVSCIIETIHLRNDLDKINILLQK